jgi:uncharacterized protein (DUF885 family)
MRILLSIVLLVLSLPLAAQAVDGDPLADFLQREWTWRLAQSPLLASSVGDRSQEDQLDQVGEAVMRARLPQLRAFRDELLQISGTDLAPTQRMNAQIVLRQIEDAIAAIDVGEYLIPMTSDSAFYSDLGMLPRMHRFDSVAGIEAYLARLAQIPRYFEQHIALLKTAVKRGMTLPQVVLKGREEPLRQIAELADPTGSPFYEPLLELPNSIPKAQQERLRKAARRLIAEQLQPAYAQLLDYFVEQYVPRARTTLAAEKLPGGKAYYRQQIRFYTTLELSPDEIHQRGLAEVQRILADMEKIRLDVGFAGDLPAFFAYLRSAPEFYVDTPAELLRHASHIAKRIDGLLPRYFGRLPRLPYTVAPVPDNIAPYYTAGRYVPASEGSLEPGTYWVNTAKLSARPLYTLPALTLHEAVPGHHLQNALAEEQGEQPPQRRHSYISAYGEGWALYTEWLGAEMGIYTTPYEHFGRLTYEMWRACRLVVDTGIHSKGWTRQQALDYMLNHTALSEHEITTEVDRYISWPGQALSYKLGEMSIRALRTEAEAALGERFDLRSFHDAVLAQGSVPLPLLEAQIHNYIETRMEAHSQAQQPKR